jgi:phosphoglycolate phosphatase
MHPQRLALFDIDGTLLTTGGAGRAALKVALERTYGTAGPIDSYDMGGRTIREIVHDLVSADLPAPDVFGEHFMAFSRVWSEVLQATLPTYPVRLIPGAQALVEALAARDDVLMGLLTANIRETARLKLAAAGIDPALFPVGAYGDVSERRADLVPFAIWQAERQSGIRFLPQQTVILGDTPRDVATAQAAGARSITVAQGGWTHEALAHAGADVVFDDFTDTAAVIEAILT